MGAASKESRKKESIKIKLDFILKASLLAAFSLGCSQTTQPSIWNTEKILEECKKTSKPRILNLWATWCAPCIEELPDLQLLRKEFSPDNLEILAISYDAMIPGITEESAIKNVTSFLNDNDYSFKVALFSDDDYSALDQGLNLPGPIPITIAYNQKGEEVGRIEGKVNINQLRNLAINACK